MCGILGYDISLSFLCRISLPLDVIYYINLVQPSSVLYYVSIDFFFSGVCAG